MMFINEQFTEPEEVTEIPAEIMSKDGGSSRGTEPVVWEHLMDVYINEVLTMKVTCTPQYLAELVLGRLCSEGIIKSSEEIEGIYICEYGSRARVFLSEPDRARPDEVRETFPQSSGGAEDSENQGDGESEPHFFQQGRDPDNGNAIESGNGKGESGSGAERTSGFVETDPTCCTGNHVLNDYFVSHRDFPPVVPIEWETGWIFSLVDRAAEDMPIHTKTHCTHSCYLASGGEILFSCEDIGRHNALDKAIGYALRNNIDLKKCILYTSGRVPTDMAVKAIHAGVPILASKKAPTREAVELAGQYGLTLLGMCRKDRIVRFT